MKDIQMVDLRSQYDRLKPDIDNAIKKVIDSTAFIKGPDVDHFEKELAGYLNANHVIACGNGTDALQIAMMALGLKPGDEVITTNFTFIATVEVVALLGLKPILTDPSPVSFNITPEAIERAITPATRAIVPVHLFGQCCDMEPIIEIARRHNLFIIEDTAQANGAEYIFSDGTRSKAGTMGDIGCTSFFPSKNLGCYGDGGALITSDDEIAALIRSIINHGMKVRYYHDNIGVNSRLDTIQAAILRVKLRHLDEFNRSRGEAARFYDEAFKGIDGIITPARMSWSTHIFHQYTLRIDGGRRDALKAYLQEKGIPSMVYYPVAISRQKAYSSYKFDENGYPVTTRLSEEVLSLPMHTELDNEQLKYITDTIITFFKNS
jgi:UDP-2-acetamido-2-deoxy-ribo-hexuluronate aminotransferase